MSTTPAFSTQVIGQTENALGALMNRVLARTGGTFRQWVALNLTVASGGVIGRGLLVSRMTGALKIDDPAALAAIAELTASHLMEPVPGEDSRVGLTDAGQERYKEIRTAIGEISARLYGDLPPDDLETAGRVLATITARANAELAGR